MSSLEITGESGMPPTELMHIAQYICEQEDPQRDYQISLMLVSSIEMQNYNRVYRGKNESTDILSFVSEDLPGHDKPVRLCDIIIDTKQLVKQKGNRTFEDEFRIVLIHGLLHLLGYDHIRSRDQEEMKIKENYYLKQLQGEELSGRR